jgi:YHS domain-containing protein
VRLRASGELPRPGSAAVVEEHHEEIDPVCGMTVEVATARYRATNEGRTYYFCSAGCLDRFTADPAPFAASAR